MPFLLRKNGIKLLYKKFGKQIDFAVKDGYSHIAVMGGDEFARGVIKLKNLATREEQELPVADAIALLK